MHAYTNLKQGHARGSDAHVASPGITSGVPQQKIVAGRFTHYLVRPILQLGPLFFGAGVLAALFAGWATRDDGNLTAATGLGYWLGIAGASLMLLMLLYPLRKRLRALRWLGSVPAWFRLHMVCGILGPALILLHTNFRLGSLNSNIALTTMMVVMISGIAGRYLYAKVHRGLYGSSIQVSEILDDTEVLKRALANALPNAAAEVLTELQSIEAKLLVPKQSFIASLLAFAAHGQMIRSLRIRILRKVRLRVAQRAKDLKWSNRQRRAQIQAIENELRLYFAALQKATRYAVYERLLALWHILHMPLFLLLIATAIIHVIAVHLY